MIAFTEASVKRVKYPEKLMKLGKDEVLKVLNIDVKNKKNVYIDLSKRTVTESEEELCKTRFGKSKSVELIMKLLCYQTKLPYNKLYQNIVFPLHKEYEHAFDAFKEAFDSGVEVFKNLNIDDNTKEILLKIIKEKMKPKPLLVTADFNITCLTFEGIDAIKAALLAGEAKSTPTIQIKFRLKGSPLYECYSITSNRKEGIRVMTIALKAVEEEIKKRGGSYSQQTNPSTRKDKEDSLEDQLNDNIKNNEDEEEEEEDHSEGIQENKNTYMV